MFRDRIEVGQQLADALIKYKDHDNAVVVALPRGGVVPAEIIAKQLNLPLEVVMVKKIGHPSNPEFAIGAVSLNSRIMDENHPVDQQYIEEETKKVRDLLERRYQKYYGKKFTPGFSGKTVIVVDDGVATGKTLMAALELIREENPHAMIVAVPVGPTDTVNQLKSYADEVICLEAHDNFVAISQYYHNFGQVSDDEVVETLKKLEHGTHGH